MLHMLWCGKRAEVFELPLRYTTIICVECGCEMV